MFVRPSQYFQHHLQSPEDIPFRLPFRDHGALPTLPASTNTMAPGFR
jgi:hypothetical protein